MRRRKQRVKSAHYCLLVNRKASRYRRRPIQNLIAAIRKAGMRYSVVEPKTAADMLTSAQRWSNFKKTTKSAPPTVQKYGHVTGLVACGGDGTVNLVARAAQSAKLPLGILPMGRFDNIARSLYKEFDADVIIRRIVSGEYRAVDCARVGDQPFFGSIGFGFGVSLAQLLAERKTPRFGVGWSQLAARAAAETNLEKYIIRVDSYRFEVKPLMFQIQLLPYSNGLQFTPMSLHNDGKAEVIIDAEPDASQYSGYIRQLFRKRYEYGTSIGLYRGERFNIQPTKGRMLYLDGELIEVGAESLEVSFCEQKLKVYC